MRKPLEVGDAIRVVGAGKRARGLLTEHVTLPNVGPMIRYRADFNKGEYLVPAKQVRRESNPAFKIRREK